MDLEPRNLHFLRFCKYRAGTRGANDFIETVQGGADFRVGIEVGIGDHAEHAFVFRRGNADLEVYGFFFVQAFTRRSAIQFKFLKVTVDDFLVVFDCGDYTIEFVIYVLLTGNGTSWFNISTRVNAHGFSDTTVSFRAGGLALRGAGCCCDWAGDFEVRFNTTLILTDN